MALYKVKIERKTSPYNKYIKWLATGEAENGAKFSMGYRTLKEATEAHGNPKLHQIIAIKK